MLYFSLVAPAIAYYLFFLHVVLYIVFLEINDDDCSQTGLGLNVFQSIIMHSIPKFEFLFLLILTNFMQFFSTTSIVKVKKIEKRL